MSTHPNAILMATLQPHDLPRKTMRAILKDAGIDPDEESPSLDLGDENPHEYHVTLMDGSYEDGYQIAAPQGSIVIWGFLTYGYGEKMNWQAVAAQQARLKEWADGVCAKHHCELHEIAITANYW